MEQNKCNSCGEAKCSCKNKDFTKAVVEIDNPEQITLMRRVVIPASMGDDTTVPPVVGKYHNVLLYYEANQKSYLYSSDGIPTLLANGLTDYEQAVNLPQINGVTLTGDKTSAELGLQSALTAGDGIEIENDTISISDIEQYAHFFDTVADMKAATNLVAGDYAKTLGFYTVNDGGGALYKITNTGTANEMDVIAVGSLYAIIVTNEANIRQFGAKGTGTDNDSNNFTNCLKYAITHGMTMRIPAGTYLVDPNIMQSGITGVVRTLEIVGDGFERSILKLNNSTEDDYFSDSTAKQIYSGVVFRGLKFIGKDNTANGFYCYSTGTEKRYMFYDCKFILKNILYNAGTANADVHRFFNCFFENHGPVITNDNQQSVGVELHGCQGYLYAPLIKNIKGGFTSFYGGVFDCFGDASTYTFDLSQSKMGAGNYGIVCNGVRIEEHNDNKLLITNENENNSIIFNDCNLGTAEELSSGYYVEVKSRGNVLFNNCSIGSNYTFHLDSSIQYTGVGPLLRFENCQTQARLYTKVTVENAHCRVINNGEYSLTDLGSTEKAGDFDWNFLERSGSALSARVKLVELKQNGIGYPAAGNDFTMTLPTGVYVKRIYIYRPAFTVSTSAYQLHVGNSDGSVVYGETPNTSTFDDEIEIEVDDVGFIADNIVKVWATGSATNVTTSGYAYIEYI